MYGLLHTCLFPRQVPYPLLFLSVTVRGWKTENDSEQWEKCHRSEGCLYVSQRWQPSLWSTDRKVSFPRHFWSIVVFFFFHFVLFSYGWLKCTQYFPFLQNERGLNESPWRYRFYFLRLYSLEVEQLAKHLHVNIMIDCLIFFLQYHKSYIQMNVSF